MTAFDRHLNRFKVAALAVLIASSTTSLAGDHEINSEAAAETRRSADHTAVRYATETIDQLEIFYRYAGPKDAPVVLLLHGFPTSSHMFRDLIPKLADRYRVIAPDYPGYGLSSAPTVEEYEYSFDRLTDVVEELLKRLAVDTFTVYVMDYGAPVGFRLFNRNPERVEGFIVQNGNAYEEGLLEFWEPLRKLWKNKNDQEARQTLSNFLKLEGTIWQFQHGTRNPDAISPDNWLVTQPLLDRPGNVEVQLQLFYDYGTNLARYPEWQAKFRKYQPPTLITWGQNDHIFPAAGAYPYLRDLPHAELHLLDTGHFALEEDGDRIAALIRDFLAKQVVPNQIQE